MINFPDDTSQDYAAPNGVVYTFEDNRWRVKSYALADGAEVSVGENPPENPAEGALWFATDRLELYVWYTEDDDGSWLPTSPLGARVSAGEALQAEINTRLGTVEGNYLKKTGDSTTGQLEVTRPGETEAGRYIFSVKAGGLEDGRQVAFRVTADGAVKAGHDTSHAFMASSNNDIVTKKFADDNYAPKREGGGGFEPCIFTCTTTQNIAELEPGYFFINNSGSIVLHHAMADGTLWCIKREGSNFVQEFPAIVTISELGGRTMYQGNMKKLTTFGTPSNATHCTLEVTDWRQKTCLNGVQYLITIPGILPRFKNS